MMCSFFPYPISENCLSGEGFVLGMYFFFFIIILSLTRRATDRYDDDTDRRQRFIRL